MTTAPVVLRRDLTPKQREVLAHMAEAPSYAKLAALLGVAQATARMHVNGIADLLPPTFLPDSATKDRVILYAVHCWVIEQTAAKVTL